MPPDSALTVLMSCVKPWPNGARSNAENHPAQVAKVPGLFTRYS
jgi:hypothetical protein